MTNNSTAAPRPHHGAWAVGGQASVLMQVSAATVTLLGAPTLANATFIPPAGVSAYRLAFVTQGSTTAESSSIEDYNTFVTAQAQLNAGLPATVWTAIGSTPAVSAVTNIDCGGSCDALPIYLVDGTKVASSASSLFAGTGSALIDEDQFGTLDSNVYVWTGSNANGSSAAGFELGSAAPIVGENDDNLDQFNYFDVSQSNAAPTPLYAISGAIAAVPEPAVGSALLAGGLIAGRAARRRRRR